MTRCAALYKVIIIIILNVFEKFIIVHYNLVISIIAIVVAVAVHGLQRKLDNRYARLDRRVFHNLL
jgi:hypothetical protein